MSVEFLRRAWRAASEAVDRARDEVSMRGIVLARMTHPASEAEALAELRTAVAAYERAQSRADRLWDRTGYGRAA